MKPLDENLHPDLTHKIIECAFKISNTLGCGFLEKVYENALGVELRRQKVNFRTQIPLRVQYQEETVGEYIADMIVENTILVEVKATEIDHPAYQAQVINYLRATNLPVGLLLNFGKPRLIYKRLVHSRNQPSGSIRSDETLPENP